MNRCVQLVGVRTEGDAPRADESARRVTAGVCLVAAVAALVGCEAKPTAEGGADRPGSPETDPRTKAGLGRTISSSAGRRSPGKMSWRSMPEENAATPSLKDRLETAAKR